MKKTIFLAAIVLVTMSLTFNNSYAQKGAMAIGGQLGYHIPSDGDNGFGFLADFEYMATPDIALCGKIGYTSWVSEKTLGMDVSMSEIPIKVGGKYFFPMSGSMALFLGAELGLHMFSTSVTYLGYSSSSSSSEVGLALMGGIHLPLSPQIDFIGDLKYSFVSDLKYLSISAGILYRLPK